jgi:hypothetical protein
MTNRVTATLPRNLGAASVSKFALELHSLPLADEYIFDFGAGRWFPPFSMVLLAMHINRFREERPNAKYIAENYEYHGYAAHMGFFKAFGLEHGKAPGEAMGSSTYVPIQILQRAYFVDQATRRFTEVGHVIETWAGGLATILTRAHAGDLHDTLTFSIREIIRNVLEHSDAPAVVLCAQHWPHKGEVEVGIADAGRGVRAGLADNTRFAFGTDREALHAALMPGVSGNPAAGKSNDVWSNSGYGLYMTNRICRQGGSFFVCSGDAGLWLEGRHKVDVASDLRGTAVRLLLNTQRLGDLRERLEQFRAEGKSAASRIAGANTSYASVASQMLARDFGEP